MSETLDAALVRAQAAVRPLASDGQHDQQRYRYTSSEAVIDESRKAFTAAGLAFQATSYGRPDAAGTFKVDYLLTHNASKQVRPYRSTAYFDPTTTTVKGGRADLGKKIDAAKTTDLAYMMRGILLIPRSDALAAQYQNQQSVTPDPRAATIDQLKDLKRQLEDACEGHVGTIDHGLEWAKENSKNILDRMMHAVEVGHVMMSINTFCQEYDVEPPNVLWDDTLPTLKGHLQRLMAAREAYA